MRTQCRLSVAIRNLARTVDFHSYFKTKILKLQLVQQITRSMGHSYCKVLLYIIILCRIIVKHLLSTGITDLSLCLQGYAITMRGG